MSIVTPSPTETPGAETAGTEAPDFSVALPGRVAVLLFLALIAVGVALLVFGHLSPGL